MAIKIGKTFIFISNTYSDSTSREPTLKGVEQDQKNYEEILQQYKILLNEYKNLDVELYFLNNLTLVDLVDRLKKIKEDGPEYTSIDLVISGHGSNAAGFVDFVTNDNSYLNLAFICTILNKDSLKSINIFIDTCRTGNVGVSSSYMTEMKNQMKMFMENKKVIIMTAIPRGEAAIDNSYTGGNLISTICDQFKVRFWHVENESFTPTNLLDARTSIEFVLSIAKHMVRKYFGDSEYEWLYLKTKDKYTKFKKFGSKDSKDLNIESLCNVFQNHDSHCNKLPSIYFNKDVRNYINANAELIKDVEILFQYLCKKYKSADAIASMSNANLAKTHIRK